MKQTGKPLLYPLIPGEYFESPHIVTRYLYLGRKQGRMTCLFKPHKPGIEKLPFFHAYPSSVESDMNFKQREDYRVYAVSYVLEGTGTVTYSDTGEVIQLKPGVFFQYNAHRFEDLLLQFDNGFSECSMCLDGTTGSHIDELEIWNHSIRWADIGIRSSVVQAYLDLYKAILDHALPARTLLGKCTMMLDTLYSYVENESGDELFRRHASSVIAGNLSPRFTMQDASRMLDMSYDSFRRRFKNVFGISPIEYQMRLRMEQARVLLIHHSVKETAAQLDYSDPFVFSRQFKKWTGVSPKEFTRME